MLYSFARRLIICIGIMMLCAGHCLCQTVLEQTIITGVRESIAKLPEESDVERVAILPLSGAETILITDIIVTTVVERGIYDVIDRSQLEILLDEVNFQMTDLVDSDTAVEAGKIAGVDAVMYGEVKRLSHSEDWADISLHLQIVRVDTGQIFWADDIARTTGKLPGPSPDSIPVWIYFLVLAVVAVVIIILVILAIFWKRRKGKVVTPEVGIDVVRSDGRREFKSTMEVNRGNKEASSSQKSDSAKESGSEPSARTTDSGIDVVRNDGTKESKPPTEVKRSQSEDDRKGN